MLLCDAFEPLDHAPHHTHGDEADDQEDSPAHPQFGHAIEHDRANPDEQVTQCGSTEPQSLADTLQVFGRNL